MCKRFFYRSTFMCNHFYDVFFKREQQGRHCYGRCPRAEEIFDHAVAMTSPCRSCQDSRTWIYIPCRQHGWRWVETAVWAREGLEEPQPQQQEQQGRRRRRRRYRTPSPHPIVLGDEEWEEWRNEEDGYWEEDYDPPPAYRP
ncbi:hypothetical protein PWT90_00825 [Aphanocladium album]|nr:hypothetical protein PWT90_00825 [Aphanocladium album]